MLGALEVKTISRLAAKHGRQWKPLHTAVMGCLLAHRNRRSGYCWPRRKDIAGYCNISERTVNRIVAQLAGWGVIERQQPRAVTTRAYGPAQYAFLFELPQSVDNPCENPNEPWAKNAQSRGPKMPRAVGQSCDPRNKERRERSEGKDLKGKGALPSQQFSRFSQTDFDERDLRKMAKAYEQLLRRNSEGWCRGSGMTVRQMFEYACECAGVTIARGLELEELRKKWPDRVPDWAKEGTG
jgi:hypothetical protein